MVRTFIEVPLFTKRWKEIGLDDKDLLRLQIMLLKDPQSGPVMEGTGGIRKVRFPIEKRGKSGSIRVCYTDFEEYEATYLITAFKKNEQENLTEVSCPQNVRLISVAVLWLLRLFFMQPEG